MKEQFVNLRQTNGDIATRLQLASQSRPPFSRSDLFSFLLLLPSTHLPFTLPAYQLSQAMQILQKRTWRHWVKTRTTAPPLSYSVIDSGERICRICMRVPFTSNYPIWTFVIVVGHL